LAWSIGLHLEDDESLTIDMTLTPAACPLTDVIEDQTQSALEVWSIGG
jgi:metal-sulfur cluster biosynthetic enzyme